jgi:hypothetical protein
MIGVVWKLYVGGDNSTLPSENVPIIRADKEPYKVQPDDPGGMQMPNKNSTIFSSLNSNDEDRGVENLLADNEEEDPVPRSQLFAGLNTERDESLHAEVQDIDRLMKTKSVFCRKLGKPKRLSQIYWLMVLMRLKRLMMN